MNTIDVVIPVYNSQDTIVDCVNSIQMQQIPDNWEVNIIIVDDASTDKSVEFVIEHFADKITLIRNKINSGRAQTRNAGTKCSDGEIVVFLDSDCIFENQSVLHRYLELINSGQDCVFANIRSRNNDFTACYVNNLSTRRFASADAGNFLEMTSASLAIRRSLLLESGGFCEEYRYYGFEDRDFIACLLKLNARLTVDKKCIVYHEDNIELSGISKKMITCAMHSAPIYFKNYPEIYQDSIYGSIDPRLSSFIPKIIYHTLVLSLPLLFKPFQSCLNNRYIPYRIKKFFVKTISFLSYIKGCLDQPVMNIKESLRTHNFQSE